MIVVVFAGLLIDVVVNGVDFVLLCGVAFTALAPTLPLLIVPVNNGVLLIIYFGTSLPSTVLLFIVANPISYYFRGPAGRTRTNGLKVVLGNVRIPHNRKNAYLLATLATKSWKKMHGHGCSGRWMASIEDD